MSSKGKFYNKFLNINILKFIWIFFNIYFLIFNFFLDKFSKIKIWPKKIGYLYLCIHFGALAIGWGLTRDVTPIIRKIPPTGANGQKSCNILCAKPFQTFMV